MTSTFSPSLRFELMATGDQSGSWGTTTNTNIGTLIEQAIAGFLSKAQGDVANLTLTATDGASDEARNMVIDITGALTAGRNVVVPTAEKLYLFKNSTTGGFAITVKTSGGTGVAIAAGTAQWVYCDGTNVVQGLSGTMAAQAASAVAITGGTIAGLTTLTMTSGAATPATNDAAALGTSTLMWSDLFLASGAVVNFNNGDVTITHSANTLAFAGASSGYTYDAAVLPSANDAAALGASGTAWADLFLASGGVINFNAGNATITHSAGLLTFNTAISIGTSNALTAGTIELGAASDTTISRSAAGVIAVEGLPLYAGIPQSSKSAAYTLVLGDAQTHIYHPTSDNNARTWTIPANSSVAFPIGTAITFINDMNTITIAITTDTLVLAGTGSTGSRTLAVNGVATAIKVTSTRWYISGTGLT